MPSYDQYPLSMFNVSSFVVSSYSHLSSFPYTSHTQYHRSTPFGHGQLIVKTKPEPTDVQRQLYLDEA